MYFDQYSITPLRYIDISFKNLSIYKPRGRSLYIFGFSFGWSYSSSLCFIRFNLVL